MIIKLINDFKIVKNFKISEFVCKDGNMEVLIDMPSICLLQKLREQFNKPVIVVSGYRSEKYNEKVGGVKNSYHLKGKAFDIRIKGIEIENLADIAQRIGFNGIGLYDYFVHVDTREVKSHWDKRGKTDNE